jgi:hypothetical protein
VRISLSHRPYRVAVAVREQPLTAADASVGRTGVLGWFPWWAVVAPWLLSRVLSVGVLLAAANDPLRGSRFVQLTVRWDGAYYLGIARDGYGAVDVLFPRWAFFPGFPAVIRLLGELGRDDVLAFVFNQLVFLVALAGVHRIAQRHGSPRAALLAVWALALFPASFVFSMTYPSSLFLACSVWAFVAVDSRGLAGHDWWAGLLAAGAAIVRPNGLIVAVALVVAVWSLRRTVAVVLPTALVLVAWCVYCYDRTGDAFVFITVKDKWQEVGVVDLVTGGEKWSVLPHALLALGALALVVHQRKRLPVAFLVLTALALVPSLVTGMVGLARYANECFPPFVAAGQVLERWSTRVQVALLGASAVGMMTFAFVVARYGLVP